MRRHLPWQTDRIHRGSSFHPLDVGLQQWKQTQPFRSTACRLFMPQYSISRSGWRSRLSPGPCPGRISHPGRNDDPGRFSRTWDLIQIDQKDSKYFLILTHRSFFLISMIWFQQRDLLLLINAWHHFRSIKITDDMIFLLFSWLNE